MNRRDFLKTIAAATALASIPKAYAVEPTTAVLTAIQMGLTAASLFGPKGADLGDLMKTQTEVLRSVSLKIDTIVSAIWVLDARLVELKKTLQDIPNDIAKTLRTWEIKGSSNRVFTEVLPGYIIDKEKLGIMQANKIWIPKMENQILPVLQNARSQLTLLDTPFVVPAMCSALTAEQAGLAFKNASEGESGTIRDIYARYFSSQIKKCKTVRSSIRESLKEYRSKLESKGVLAGKGICLVDGSRRTLCEHEYKVQVFDCKPVTPLPSIYQQQPAYSELFAAGYLEDTDWPPDLTGKYVCTVTGSKVLFRPPLSECSGHPFLASSPIPFDELLRLAGPSKYVNNLATALQESGRVCPPGLIDSQYNDSKKLVSEYDWTSIKTAFAEYQYDDSKKLVSEYEDKFNELCFYSSMQHASERAMASLFAKHDEGG